MPKLKITRDDFVMALTFHFELSDSNSYLDIDSDEVTLRIVVEHGPFGNLPTFHARLL